MPTPIESHTFILKAFAAANPVYVLNLWNDPVYRKGSFAHRLTRFLTHPDCTATLYGQPLRVRTLFDSIDKLSRFSACPPVAPVFHTFPVYAGELDTGLMVPMEIAPGEEWHVSDAFGTFGFTDTHPRSISQVLNKLLQRIEKVWLELHPGRVLPLRWRRSFSLKLLCPVHFNAVEGESLQVPLMISLLRAISEQPATEQSEAVLPFGNVPVFATGTLQWDNSFGPILSLEKKLEGFVREYGEGLPAILTSLQIEELESGEQGKGLLRGVVVYRADNLQQLLDLPGLKQSLDRLCDAPHPTEIDELLSSMRKMQRGVRFDDVEAMSQWLLPHIGSPVYRFRLLRESGFILTHRGLFSQARDRFLQATEILSRDIQWFGTAEKIQLATAWGTLAFDACEPSLAEPLFREVEAEVPYASAPDRARFWGACCQLYRLSGQRDKAVEAGYRSIHCTDIALASEGGRDRNYLIHALIARARSNPAAKEGDLEQAAEILRQSQSEWAPLGNMAAKRVHLGFCLHYEAEIARLRDQPFTPPDAPLWFGTWGHPWMFVLLSCTRNILHHEKDRIRYAQELVRCAEKEARHPDAIFNLFLAVYRIYLEALQKGDCISPLRDLENWCQLMESKGFPGWKRRLEEPVRFIYEGKEGSVELLCDAVPYH